MKYLWIGLAGAVGAVTRYVVAALPWAHWVDAPIGVLVVNVTGSFLLGLTAGSVLPPDLRLVVGGGFLGSYTTFSTWAVDLVRAQLPGAVLNLMLSIGLGLAAAWLGGLTATRLRAEVKKKGT